MIGRRSGQRLALVATGVLPILGLALAPGCSDSNGTKSVKIPVANRPAVSQFVGSQACAECHKTNFDKQHASRHAKTMRVANQAGMGEDTPSAGVIPGSVYAVRETGADLRFERADEPSMGTKMELALGSGKDAITFVGEVGSERINELRMTYLPGSKTWSVTPGQQEISNLALGRTQQMGFARKCITCHAVTTADDSLMPPQRLIGISCESCHGPAKAHVESARTGTKTPTKVEDPRTWTASQIVESCSRCHRSVKDVMLDGMQVGSTTRFQGYGLELSRCYKESQGKLSCITCHDPHGDDRTDRANYVKTCQRCHSKAAKAPASICPVQPTGNCIPCHMPKRNIFPGQRHINVPMADHLIQVYPVRKGSLRGR